MKAYETLLRHVLWPAYEGGLRRRETPRHMRRYERDQWLACMDQAMGETGVPEDLRTRLKDSFFQTADWMRNRGG